jgi:hypothetical protein
MYLDANYHIAIPNHKSSQTKHHVHAAAWISALLEMGVRKLGQKEMQPRCPLSLCSFFSKNRNTNICVCCACTKHPRFLACFEQAGTWLCFCFCLFSFRRHAWRLNFELSSNVDLVVGQIHFGGYRQAQWRALAGLV